MNENALLGPPLVLGRYSEADLLAMFADAGVLARIEERGFTGLAFEFDASQGPLTHVRLLGTKSRERFLLLDACLTDVQLPGDKLCAGSRLAGARVGLVVVYWLREQDPTAVFDADHVRLPLQEHPGLGVLRRAFRVALRMTRELGRHGVAALPKFFHDAAIFYRSRLFLFLDPREQGRFEALLRDLGALSLQDTSLALAGHAVVDDAGQVAHWQPGLQVMPLLPLLTDYFNSDEYQDACTKTLKNSRFVIDEAALAAARLVYERSIDQQNGPAR